VRFKRGLLAGPVDSGILKVKVGGAPLIRGTDVAARRVSWWSDANRGVEDLSRGYVKWALDGEKMYLLESVSEKESSLPHSLNVWKPYQKSGGKAQEEIPFKRNAIT